MHRMRNACMWQLFPFRGDVQLPARRAPLTLTPLSSACGNGTRSSLVSYCRECRSGSGLGREPPIDGLDEKLAFSGLHARSERGDVIAGQHRHGPLCEDWASAVLRVDQMDSRCRLCDPGGEDHPVNVLAIHALPAEPWEWCGVRVEHAPGEGVQEQRADFPHEPGEHDQADLAVAEQPEHCLVACVWAENTVIEHGMLDPEAIGDPQRWRVLPAGYEQHGLSCHRAPAARVRERLKRASGSGGEDRDTG